MLSLIHICDQNGRNVEPILAGFKSYSGLTEGETYTYTVTANDYRTKTGEFTYKGTPETVGVSLEATNYTIKFNIHPGESVLQVFNEKGETVDPVGEKTYLLSKGNYYYCVSSSEYGSKAESFTVGGSSENRSRTIHITLEEGHIVRIETNAIIEPEITVYINGNVPISSMEGNLSLIHI